MSEPLPSHWNPNVASTHNNVKPCADPGLAGNPKRHLLLPPVPMRPSPQTRLQLVAARNPLAMIPRSHQLNALLLNPSSVVSYHSRVLLSVVMHGTMYAACL